MRERWRLGVAAKLPFSKSWMTRLERKVFDLIEEAQDINDDFRLYLTSFPASYFPVSVLQTVLK